MKLNNIEYDKLYADTIYIDENYVWTKSGYVQRERLKDETIEDAIRSVVAEGTHPYIEPIFKLKKDEQMNTFIFAITVKDDKKSVYIFNKDAYLFDDYGGCAGFLI